MRRSSMFRTQRIRQRLSSGRYVPMSAYNGPSASARYDAATAFRIRAGRSFSYAKAEYAAASRPTRVNLIEACREAYRSNGLFRRMINAEVENIVGVGFRVIPLSRNPEWNAVAREWLREKYKAHNFHYRALPGRSEWGCMKLMCEHHHREGGMLAYRTAAGMQMIEELQIQQPLGRINDPSCIDGFQFGDDGGLVGFWVGEYKPEGYLEESDMSLIPAYHLDRRFGVMLNVCSYIVSNGFVSGFRGSPPLAPCLDDLERFADYYDAITERACQEACVTGVIKSDDPDASDSFNVGRTDYDSDSDPNVTIYTYPKNLEPGVISHIRKDDDFDIKGLTTPGNNFDAFTKQSVRVVGAPASMPLEIVLMHFADTNFAASKAAIEQFHIACRMTKKYYACEWSIPNYEMAVYEGMRDNELPFEETWQDCAVVPSGWKGLENYKDTNAAIARVNGGLSSLSAEQAEMLGADFEDTLDQRISELETIERKASEHGRDVEEVKRLAYSNPYAEYRVQNDRQSAQNGSSA